MTLAVRVVAMLLPDCSKSLLWGPHQVRKADGLTWRPSFVHVTLLVSASGFEPETY
jgi:hypothetical protein